MKDLAVLTLIIGLIAQVSYSEQYNWEEEFAKNTAERVRDHGYPGEIHQVETVDNYVISMYRIPYSNKLQNQNQQKPAILLQHGMTSCSDAWILNGPNDALAFLLADAGYDVWMGNARGNRYSRNNTRLSTRHPHFYRFSWHEVGALDLPAMIDYIIETTGEKAIHYAGHSQGTTAFFVMASFRPEYNAKIKTSHMLAPVAFMSNMTLALAKYTRRFISEPNTLTKLLDDIEVMPDALFLTSWAEAFCAINELTQFLCSRLVMTTYDIMPGNTNLTVAERLNETHPAGISTNQLLHYMQEYGSGRFCQYDYGLKKNLKLYGRTSPPDYDISQITSDLYFYYSTIDNLADIRDVEYFASILPRKPNMFHVPDPTFGHGDFVWAYQVKEVINDRIIAACDAYEDEHSVFDNLLGDKNIDDLLANLRTWWSRALSLRPEITK